MSQQIRHDLLTPATTDTVEATLGEIRCANLLGRLYVHPQSGCKRAALQALRSAGLVERIPPTRYCGGGWFARPAD
jgi:hypothetical protein